MAGQPRSRVNVEVSHTEQAQIEFFAANARYLLLEMVRYSTAETDLLQREGGGNDGSPLNYSGRGGAFQHGGLFCCVRPQYIRAFQRRFEAHGPRDLLRWRCRSSTVSFEMVVGTKGSPVLGAHVHLLQYLGSEFRLEMCLVRLDCTCPHSGYSQPKPGHHHCHECEYARS
ncbi:hypothetical protein FKP32DRAFT_162860 [Trametes sanguinea]|nr:hypothetical protein FKP32DRAFT_162860 [Trametes sanguinea]